MCQHLPICGWVYCAFRWASHDWIVVLLISLHIVIVCISDVREIPDNQEVFAHSHTDQSIIIEILEYVQEPDEQAVK